MRELLNEAHTSLSFSGNATPLIEVAMLYLIILMDCTHMSDLIEQFFNLHIMSHALHYLMSGLMIVLMRRYPPFELGKVNVP